MKKRDRDWLERQGFDPEIENSGRNPFLREHLPAEDIRPLERASIAATYAVASGTGVFWVGLMGLGPHLPQWYVPPAWLSVASALIAVAAGATLLFFGYRGLHRIEAAWRKALQHYDEAAEAVEDARRAQVLAEMNRPRV